MWWMKLTYLSIERIKYVQKFIFYYDYPKFSKYMWVVLLLMAFFAELSYFPHYFLLFFITCFIVYSP